MLVNKDVKRGKLYSNTFPKGSCIIGTIEREDGSVGALIRLKNGYYAQINAGEMKTLDQHLVKKRLRVKCEK